MVGGGAGGAGTRHPPRRSPRPARAGVRHFGGKRPDPYLEAIAARRGGGQHRSRRIRGELPRPGALARLPLSLRRDDRARSRATRGASRRRVRRRRARDHATAVGRLRHAGDRDRQRHQRFRHTGRCRICGAAGDPGAGGALQPAPGQRLPARADAGRPGASGPASRGDRRCRRDRHRTGRRTASHDPRSGRLRARSHRPAARRPHRPDRGRVAHPDRAAGTHIRGDRNACSTRWASRSAPAPR